MCQLSCKSSPSFHGDTPHPFTLPTHPLPVWKAKHMAPTPGGDMAQPRLSYRCWEMCLPPSTENIPPLLHLTLKKCNIPGLGRSESQLKKAWRADLETEVYEVKGLRLLLLKTQFIGILMSWQSVCYKGLKRSVLILWVAYIGTGLLLLKPCIANFILPECGVTWNHHTGLSRLLGVHISISRMSASSSFLSVWHVRQQVVIMDNELKNSAISYIFFLYC